MGCNGNHKISYNQNAFIFEDNIFAFKWSNLKINIHKKMSSVFNVGLITSWDTSSSYGFPLIFKFSLIFMNMQTRYFSYRTTGRKYFSNCITHDIKYATMVV